MSTWSDTSSLHDVFAERTGFLVEYQPYMSGYGRSMLYLAYFVRKYKGVSDVLREFNALQRKTTKLTVESLLIMPVQRCEFWEIE